MPGQCFGLGDPNPFRGAGKTEFTQGAKYLQFVGINLIPEEVRFSFCVQ